jgi:hypothetical protein
MPFSRHHGRSLYYFCLMGVIAAGTVVETSVPNELSPTQSAQLRKYFIAADAVWWDYAPLGYNGCTGRDWDDVSKVYTTEGVGSRYLKAVFRQYESNFTVRFYSFNLADRASLVPALILAFKQTTTLALLDGFMGQLDSQVFWSAGSLVKECCSSIV